MARERLPNRRGKFSESYDVGGIRYHVDFGFQVNDDGQQVGPISEVFIVAGKPGSPVEAVSRDTGLLLSLALQHKIPIQEMRDAMTKLDHGEPAGPLGVILDALAREEQ